ncbi:MAG: TonB family protein, partial [Thermoanaerobaculaceae bacterium]|nr:TonB family protein [Thermoanaerobaculaceae bacterium]
YQLAVCLLETADSTKARVVLGEIVAGDYEPAVKNLAAPYLAPEVLTNGRPTGRSDVYSLGAILYHLLTATPLPAEPDERAAALEKPQLALDEGPVPQDVLAILRKTLAVRPEDRYTSAGEFKRELERLLYGGAYSPTTFNLALFMDRLYRNEMEQEDRELERERSLDVAPYYHPPRAEVAEAPAPAAEAPTPNRTFLYAIAGGAVVLLSVIGYLLVSRPPSAPVDAEAQKRMLQELVNTQVTLALKEKEEQLRKELEAEKARTEELRQQLDKQKQGAAGSRRVGSDEQRLQNELAAREAEQKKKEDELARVRQQQEAEAARAREQQAQLASNPAAAQVVAVAAIDPTPMPPAPMVPLAVAAAGPAPAAAAPAALPAAARVSQAPSTTGSGVVEGDLVDLTEVDVPPQTLVDTKVTLPRDAARAPLSGYVILRVLVNEKGGVDDVAVLRGFSPPRPGIDEACVNAVKQRRYKPAMKNGQRVKTWLTVKLNFIPAAR